MTKENPSVALGNGERYDAIREETVGTKINALIQNPRTHTHTPSNYLIMIALYANPIVLH